ncbi:MAG: tagaturonate reductase [Lachnospiraceae bacterium]|nr:tagaturonate reductase [Lachnospiraceae bacterium]MBO4788494.1 tagaturonate reductase [Lachnospiraceae bacterium]
MAMNDKERVIQFGEGGFLRSFADVFIHKMNEQGLYDGKVVVVQPIAKGLIPVINEQKGVYHQFLRGIDDGKVVDECIEVHSISRGVDPYTNYAEFLKLAENPDMQVIISNTTEAGIEYLGTEKLTDAPPKSFPAKLTALLYARYRTGLPGFVILSCELIDNNGGELLKCVLQYAELWKLPVDFTAWLKTENHFCNTLVDRICTGYPKDEVEALTERLGQTDRLMNTAEIFHLWVIEGNHEAVFPLQAAGINVIWTDDVKPYKKRKVRILNGGHTSMVLGARLYGLSTVKECLDDPVVSRFLKKAMFEEIIPTLGHEEEDIPFGNAVLERFANPFVKHQLLSIALNSVSKFKARVLPTILEYREQRGCLPKALTFSLAALIAFYRTDEANDNADIMAYMKTAAVRDILARQDYWGQDLTFMADEVEHYCRIMREQGMASAYEEVLK